MTVFTKIKKYTHDFLYPVSQQGFGTEIMLGFLALLCFVLFLFFYFQDTNREIRADIMVQSKVESTDTTVNHSQ